MKIFMLIVGLLFTSLFANEDEPQGYKVVLMSYGSFVEAKEALNNMELIQSDRDLQTKYKFEFVARPSGKSYILAIEPLSGQSIANIIIEHFKPQYKNAYSSQYFGPTKGTVFLNHKIAIQEATKKVVKEKEVVSGAPKEQSKSDSIPWIWIMIIGVPVLGSLSGLLLARSKRA
jgi:hypothetical protein